MRSLLLFLPRICDNFTLCSFHEIPPEASFNNIGCMLSIVRANFASGVSCASNSSQRSYSFLPCSPGKSPYMRSAAFFSRSCWVFFAFSSYAYVSPASISTISWIRSIPTVFSTNLFVVIKPNRYLVHLFPIIRIFLLDRKSVV